MIEPSAVDEIITQYEKHGWTLRRALLSPDGKETLKQLDASVDVLDSDIDALWFSRRSQPDREAWELRRLTSLPFALIAVITDDTGNDEIEETLSQVVDELRAKTFA
ncbi:MAG TPA: hypothetical protein VJV05_07780 [Pyrinomonadaceae bacterium]|nr:hypothetical protein [Pyrinomonadaceae bacterium]